MIKILGVLPLLLPLTARAEGLPHLGVRYIYNPTPIYSANDPSKQVGEIGPNTAVLPCVIVKNGAPLVGPKGEVLLGFKQVYKEPIADQTTGSLLQRHQNIQLDRQKGFDELKKVQAQYDGKTVDAMDCEKGADQAVPLGSLNPGHRTVKYSPPRLEDTVKKSLELLAKANKPCDNCKSTSNNGPQELLKQFHNSDLCIQTELSVGQRKNQLLKNWDKFIADKVALNPALKANLAKAKAIDIAARTAVYEGDNTQGCSARGVCERDIVLLSLRNRAQDSRCEKGHKPFGCAHKGDVVGVATPESQYNIWSDFFSDTSYLTSCFLRTDLHPDNPLSQSVNWGLGGIDKTIYQKTIRMFESTAKNAEKILFATDDELKTFFKTENLADLTKMKNYYHPQAMSPCYPQFPNLKYIPEAYVTKGGKFFPLRKEYVNTLGPGSNGDMEFETLSVDGKGTQDPIDDTFSFKKSFVGATVPVERMKDYKASNRCSPLGVDPQCNVSNSKYYRLYPSWLALGHFAEINCKGTLTTGGSCGDSPTTVPEVPMGDRCNRVFTPVAGIP